MLCRPQSFIIGPRYLLTWTPRRPNLFSFFFPLVDASLCLKANLHALQPDDSRCAPSTHNVTEEPCDTTLFHFQSVIKNPDSINIAGVPFILLYAENGRARSLIRPGLTSGSTATNDAQCTLRLEIGHTIFFILSLFAIVFPPTQSWSAPPLTQPSDSKACCFDPSNVNTPYRYYANRVSL